MARRNDGAGGVLHFFAGSNAHLRFDQIDAGDQLGDRVLDLDASVHFDEVERTVLIHQKLDRSRVGVADCFQSLDDPRAKLLPPLGIHHRGW